MSPSDELAAISLFVALASLVISLVSIFIAVYGINKGNKNASAAILIQLNDGFREGWRRYLQAETDHKSYEFSELMNLVEIACAVLEEGSLVGVSREIMREYLHSILTIIEGDSEARALIQPMRHSTTTFKYIYRFLLKNRIFDVT